MRQQQTCALDVMLFTEQVPRADAIMSSLFPVNALRSALQRHCLMASVSTVPTGWSLPHSLGNRVRISVIVRTWACRT